MNASSAVIGLLIFVVLVGILSYVSFRLGKSRSQADAADEVARRMQEIRVISNEEHSKGYVRGRSLAERFKQLHTDD